MQPPTTPHELRQEYRLNAQETVYLELNQSSADTSTSIVVSTSLDMSANGLRVIADQPLETGTILRSCVRLRATGAQFVLVCEVKWARPYGDAGEFLLGLSLYESEGSDILPWKEFIAQSCSEQSPEPPLDL
jgi:hypothetical protein